MYVPAVWGGEQQVLRYEAFIVKHLQAPTQQNTRHCSDIHVNRFRPWPRLRNRPTDDMGIEVLRRVRVGRQELVPDRCSCGVGHAHLLRLHRKGAPFQGPICPVLAG